jgi:hypothetical protein
LRPHIDGATFGSITVEGQRFDYDIVIDLDGVVTKRKKKLSKRLYGTSHVVSLDEARAILQQGATGLIVGTGHFDRVRLSDEAAAHLQTSGYRVELLPLKRAISAWNEKEGALIGLFHVTC